MDPIQEFKNEVKENIDKLGSSKELQKKSLEWMLDAGACGNYTYNFNWLGRPIIQYPQDMVAMQELIYKVKPDLIIETGIAHGGSLIFSASMLVMLDYIDAIESGAVVNPTESKRKVVGIDIDIREHNKKEIEKHPLSHMITMIQGSSIDDGIIEQVRELSKQYKKILVSLDSNHTHEHVLAELQAYACLVSKDSYCVVFDTVIEDMPDDIIIDRPWKKGNSPKTAVWEFLKTNNDFEIDKNIENKILITVAPDGFLKKVK